jgi:hypothetical protein
VLLEGRDLLRRVHVSLLIGMSTWHDLRIWLSGFLAALALVAFVTATLMRARDRARREEEERALALPKRPVAKAAVPDKDRIFRA